MQINIINFQDKFEKDFYELNIEWLEYFFQVEEYDYEVLSNSKKYIINKGGKIFFAELEGNIIGTIALMPTNKKLVFELTKMAVRPEYRNKGIGKKLLKKCVEFSRFKNYKSIIIYSNRKLRNAIYLYKAFGFIEIKIEKNSPYLRADIKMVKILN
tara:strand:+ start:266 stop:733 length:468 start_codon:yes stop_codon:yes gene_type:complete